MKPPYFILSGTCLNTRCANRGRAFSRLAKKATFESTEGTTKPRTDISCPSCLTWSKVVRIQEVTA